MALHVGHAKQVIWKRGKKASRTPLGRALFASYFRMDIAMSVIMGNPVFLDEKWWTNDPLTTYALTSDTPILTCADAALSKLTVIVAKMTLLKNSATTRRRKLTEQLRSGATDKHKSQALESRLLQQVGELQQELELWERGLPPWFKAPTNSDTMDDTTLLDAKPSDYVHPHIPSVISCAYAVNIHLWRIAYPNEPTPPAAIRAVITKLMRTFLEIPESADLMIIPNIWSGGLFLRESVQRDRLETHIMKRIDSTDFFFWKFCLDGLRHGWLDEGDVKKQFRPVLRGAQEVVPGVSENMYRAEGVMQLTNRKGADQEEGEQLYRFKGESKLFNASDDEDMDQDYIEARRVVAS
jgi:hypothetical protein